METCRGGKIPVIDLRGRQHRLRYANIRTTPHWHLLSPTAHHPHTAPVMSTPTPNPVGSATTDAAVAATNVAATTTANVAGNTTAAELDRDQVQARLAGAGFMPPDHPHFMHGRLFGSLHPDSAKPRVKWASSEPPRKDHGEVGATQS